MTVKISPRVLLVLIAAIFLLPLLLAWLMYNGTIAYKPAATRNLGTLVEPPLPLGWREAVLVPDSNSTITDAAESMGDHWVILYPVPDYCSETCLQEISSMRQIHRAAGRNQHRIRIALLVPDPGEPDFQTRLREMYSKFDLFRDPSGKVRSALARAGEGPGTVYLIDPLGNIIMTYEAGADPNNLKQDLKRLLTWSKLDES